MDFSVRRKNGKDTSAGTDRKDFNRCRSVSGKYSQNKNTGSGKIQPAYLCSHMKVLEHLAELVGVSKLEGDYAVTTLEFSIEETVSYDIPIPKSTEVETEDGNYIFATDEDATITAGTLSVDA